MRAIQAKTAEAFQKAYNKAWEELAEHEPVERWATTTDFCVYLIYDETIKTPQTAREIYEYRGEVYHCYDCPYLGRQSDMRVKYIPCPTGRTTARSTCCDMFYELLAKGEITPVEL